MTKIARKRVTDAAASYRLAEAETVKRQRILKAAVANANRDGVSEYDLAELAGVSRMTIRAWLGK